MKLIQLQNSEKEAVCDAEDFERLSKWTWRLDKDGYAVSSTTAKGKRVDLKMHRMVVVGEEVDHRDGNKLNNQRSNLRPVTRQQNSFNMSAHKNSTSPYKGVSFDPKRRKWRAQIMVDGRGIFIGRFPEERFAAYAYDIAAGDLFGEFAYLNFLAYSFSKSGRELVSDPQLPA